MRDRRVVVALRVFSAFQRLLSPAYRRRHGRAALALFEELAADACASGGGRRLLRVTVSALLDLLRRAPSTWSSVRETGATSRSRGGRLPFEAGDARRALRSLSRQPAFVLVTVLTLGLATGMTTSVLAVADAALFRPLPYEDAGGLYNLTTYYTGRRAGAQVSYLDYMDMRRDAATVLSESALVRSRNPTLTGDGEPAVVEELLVTSDFFRLLRLTPSLGRFFTQEEDRRGHNGVAVLSWSLWQSRFGGDPGVIGRTIHLSGQPLEVVGIGPRDFPDALPAIGKALVYQPFGYIGMSEDDLPSRGNESYSAIVRLAPGVSVDRANAGLDRVMEEIERTYPGSNTGQRTRVEPLRENVVTKSRPALLIFLAAVCVVLVIAVTNVVNVTLARASDRRRELSLRAALGAGRTRLAALLIGESLILALVGGAAGWLLALGATRLVIARAGSSLPLAGLVRLDWRILLATGTIVLVAGLVTGLVVALQSTRGDLNPVLVGGGRGVIGAGSRLRRSLVMAQVALCVVLVVSAGLLVRSLGRVLSVDPGFDTHVLAFGLNATAAAWPGDAGTNTFYDRVLENIRAIPGVEAAATIGYPPMNGGSVCGTLYAEEDPHRFDGQDLCAEVRPISPGYFGVMGIGLDEGRAFTTADDSGSVLVGIVSETTAHLLWPGQDPIGKRFNTGLGGRLHEVVGVVPDVKQFHLDETTPPQTYLPDAQWSNRGRYVVVRTGLPAEAMWDPIRSAVWAVDDAVPLRSPGTLADNVRRTLVASRFRTQLLVSVAMLALVLAVIGLYGVIAGAVARRRGEMAIRMSLGARPLRVVRMILLDGGRLVVAGSILGLFGAWAASRVLGSSSLLFGIEPTDPATFLLAPLIVLASAVVALLIPATRATRVDPAESLRRE